MDTIRRSFTYLRPYLPIALGAFFAMLLATAANLTVPQVIRRLIDDGIAVNDWNGILWATGLLLGLAIIRGGFNFLNAYWSEKASQGIAFDLRNQVYRKLETLSFSYHDNHQTGQLMTRTTSDVEGVRTFYAQGFLQLAAALITFLGSAIILFITDWRLALASLSTIPPIIYIFLQLFKILGPRFGLIQQKLGTLNTVLQESISGVRVVKTFTGEAREFDRYAQRNEELYEENLSVIRFFARGFPFLFFLSNLGTLIVIWYGGNRVISQELSLGTLIAFNSYQAFLFEPIMQMGFISQQLSRAVSLSERLFEIIDAESEIKERPEAIGFRRICTGAESPLPGLTFKYPSAADDKALNNISFNIEPGQTVAILGPTGSGKSSLINLIPRFYEVTAGSVRIDGVDVRDVTLDSLRHRVGVVLQDVNLLAGYHPRQYRLWQT